jgi:hypothetical protein
MYFYNISQGLFYSFIILLSMHSFISFIFYFKLFIYIMDYFELLSEILKSLKNSTLIGL